MRRSRRVDWLLLGSSLSIFIAMLVGGIQAYQASGARVLPFRVTGAQGASGYPIVLSLRTPHAEIRPGDRVLRLSALDLQGLTWAEIQYRSIALLGAGERFAVVGEHDGARFETEIEPLRLLSWWWPLPTWAAFVLAGSFVLIRAPHWHLARVFFVFTMAWACFGVAWGDPGHSLQKILGLGMAMPLAFSLTVWIYLSWAESAPPGRWGLAAAWAIGIAWAAVAALAFLLALPTGTLPFSLRGTLGIVTVAFISAALVRAYRLSEALERRQLRWIFFATAVAGLPIVLMYAAAALLPRIDERFFTLGWSFLGVVPLGYAVAIVGYGWLDIDRLISASAAATAVGVALVAGLLAIVPPLSSAASTTFRVDPETARVGLSIGLALVLLPAYRRLRPWLDQRLFAEQHALGERFERLRAELGAARGVEEMATRAGEGFEALLRPESVAIYGRAGEAFTPLFQRGQALPPAFEANSVLVQVLEAKLAPLLATSKELGPFERAALETLGAEVVVPLLRETQLVAFTCIGAKRNGDIYTASDLALMASAAERCAEVIARIDSETLAREAQAMQLALRRYVPGAVADRVLAGDALAPAECDVTVLFVDIRGYTGIADQLAAEDVFNTLNEHTERVSRVVQENGGTIVEFNGDGMMAVFGAPGALAKKERSAVNAARNTLESMPAHLGVGIGVATGTAFVGSIRSTDRLIWSAVGSTTNLAARLQTMTRELDASIAIDETTHERAGYVCSDFERHENLAIRGRTGRFDVFVLPLR